MSLYEKRVAHLQKLMEEQGISASFFFHYTELAYFTGCHLGNLLFVPVKGSPIVFTRKVLHRIQELSLDVQIISYRSYKDLLPLLQVSDSKIAIPLGSSSYTQIEKLTSSLKIPLTHLVDAQPLLNQITLIKTQEEVSASKRANDHIVEILKSLRSADVLGKSEAHISGLLYSKLRDIGFIGEHQFRGSVPFTGPAVLTKDSIITLGSADVTYSGKGLSTLLATGSGGNIIEKNIPFIIDIMNNETGVFADVTRTFVVGEPSNKLQTRYNDLCKIYTFIQEICKVGTSCTEVYEKTLLYVQKMDYQDHFMGLKPDQAPFIGHNIGAWVDELPAFSRNMPILLQENMTFALEPKLYFEDFDSPGIESTFVQRKNSVECLTNLSNELIIL